MMHRLTKNFAPLHAQMAGLARRRRAAIDIENVMLAAVRMEMRRQNSSLHRPARGHRVQQERTGAIAEQHTGAAVLPVEDARDRKSTRLNSSHIPLSRM